MMIPTSLTRLLLLALVAVMAVAAAPAQTADGTIARRAVVTTAAANDTCVNGKLPVNHLWSITFATVTPTATSNYGIDPTWSAEHAVMTMDLGLTHGGDMDLYGAFKCQFHCDAAAGCHSFFGRYLNVNTSTEHFECVGFNALLNQSVFVPDYAHPAAGAFDELCSHPTSIYHGRSVHSFAHARRNVVTKLYPAPGCTAAWVPPLNANGSAQYFPNNDFQSLNLISGVHNASASDSAGQAIMMDSCAQYCTEMDGCKSFFVSYGNPDPHNGNPDSPYTRGLKWFCQAFSEPLYSAVYVRATKNGTWEMPWGGNVDCDIAAYGGN